MADLVVPGVRRIGLGISNAYLLDADDGLVLLDTGVPGRTARIARAVADAGRATADIRTIVLTHDHADHAGSLARVAAASGAAVLVPELDAGPIRDGLVPPAAPMSGPLGFLARRLSRPTPLEACRIDRLVRDGDVLGEAAGLLAIHTPGHTRGHTAYLWAGGGGVLFAGDAAANLLGLRPAIVNEDAAAARASARRLAELDFSVVVFGHGRPIRGDAHARFRRWVDRLAG